MSLHRFRRHVCVSRPRRPGGPIGRRLLIGAALFVALGGSPPLSLRATPHTASAGSLGGLFEFYRSGQFDTVDGALRQPDVPWLAWVTEAGVFTGAHRTDLVAAAFLLEVAQAAYVRAVPHAVDVFEDGCAIARRGPPGTDFDRAWQLAALSLMEGRGPAPDFASAPPYTGSVNVAVDEAQRHLPHLMGRGLSPGIAALAKGINAEQYARNGILVVRTVQQAAAATPRSEVMDDPARARQQSTGERRVNMSQELQAIAIAIKALDAAAMFEDVRAEATLRRAGLEAFRAENGEALGVGWSDGLLEELAGVESMPSERRQVYLSRLLRAQYLQARGRLDQAAAMYRSAADLIPEATSARLGLTTVAYLQGVTLPAADALAALPGRPGYDADPWTSFRYGDYRLWPERLQALRAQVEREIKR
jgi:hypothetical protein